MMEQSKFGNITPLDVFFEMFDAVEEDISQLISDENEENIEVGGYECLLIAFSNLQLYCESSGINLRQIEDQYQALKESPANEDSSLFSVHEDLDENNEVVNFCKLLEQVENSLSHFEQRCENSEEMFDEWNGVLIMYSYLRNYCLKENVDFEKLQEEISQLNSEMKKDENP
jgi:flagellar biosynthesis chaperone FliJ